MHVTMLASNAVIHSVGRQTGRHASRAGLTNKQMDIGRHVRKTTEVYSIDICGPADRQKDR
jgi:hypothetical protein